ncbi:MAG TPA: glycosyltransferase family 39 protein, partial [Blastocatellia bacterium]|nr:glycosyltransferase family 39 protein [Blastocatellia bacterium]
MIHQVKSAHQRQTEAPGNEAGKRRGLHLALLIAVLSGAVFLYLAILTPDRFGAYHDDGIYVATARALANGEGHRLISLPYEPAQTKYPPFYTLLLSLIWRVYPQFPENLTAMVLLSIVATLGFMVITFRYLTDAGYANRWQALIVVALAAINWRTMILATSIYSEMTYSALSVAGLYLAEKYDKDRMRRGAGLLLGVIIGLAFLTRSSGIALLIAVAAFYMLRRQLRRNLLSVGVASLFVVGWALWVYANRTTAEGVNVAYYTSYLGFFSEAVSGLQAQLQASKLAVLIGIAFQNL